MNLSFAQFRAIATSSRSSASFPAPRTCSPPTRGGAREPYGDIEDYRRLVQSLAAARRDRGAARGVARALDILRPGDVLVVGRRGGRVVVLAQESRRNGPPRVLALNESRTLVRLGPSDFDAPPEPVGRIALPEPYAPRSTAFKRGAVESLRRIRVRGGGRGTGGSDDIRELESAVTDHPVAQDPERDARVRASVAVERLERESARLERRVRGREREPRPPVRPRARGARELGLRRGMGAHPPR